MKIKTQRIIGISSILFLMILILTAPSKTFKVTYSKDVINSKMKLAYDKGVGRGIEIDKSIIRSWSDTPLTEQELEKYYLRDLADEIID